MTLRPIRGWCSPASPLVSFPSFKQKDGKNERNDRLFVVPDRSPFEGDLKDIRRLPKRAKDELEQFFEATNALEDKQLKFGKWGGPAQAITIINKLAQ
jgi:inorganic pyrophosphatase